MEDLNQPKHSPKLEDVAHYAGVSPASVSRVLNRVEPTSARLREAVENAARELGYIPKRATSRTTAKSIAVLSPDLLNPYFNETAVGIEDRARDYGFVPFLANITRAGLDPAGVVDWLRTIDPKGCIVFGGVLSDEALIAFSLRTPFPVVAINQAVNHPGLKSITIDYAKATYTLSQHLFQLGHRDIVFLGGSQSAATSRGKIQGIENAARETGLDLGGDWIFPGAPTIEWGFQAMTALLSPVRARRPTAVVCSCDLVALGALHAVRSAGLSVPRDVSVVGFDDIDMACHANPPLTTISPPKYEMGAQAVELLVASRSDGDPIKNYVMLESPLIVRESTAVCGPKNRM
ncbi:MAG TPA: LacI family DNA-binding transcriptional regulator [Spirochaetia bacterium]|nr:LacI family DNA-binding transcriptional regulator [Spirochaetia bacterium]